MMKCLQIGSGILLFSGTDLFPAYGRIARLGRSIRLGGESISLRFWTIWLLFWFPGFLPSHLTSERSFGFLIYSFVLICRCCVHFNSQSSQVAVAVAITTVALSLSRSLRRPAYQWHLLILRAPSEHSVLQAFDSMTTIRFYGSAVERPYCTHHYHCRRRAFYLPPLCVPSSCAWHNKTFPSLIQREHLYTTNKHLAIARVACSTGRVILP